MRNRFSDVPPVLGSVGLLLLPFGGMLLVPVLVGVAYGEHRDPSVGVWPFVVPAAASFAVGLVLCWRCRRRALSLRQSAVVCVLGWVVVSAVGALPFTMALGTNYLDAYFESMSGFTTTGITMLTGLDTMQRSILFWRALTQWIGGLGILSFFLFVTYAGSSGSRLMAAESHKISAKRPAPGLFHTLKILWAIYAGATLLVAGLLLLWGTSAFDAVAHALTTLSTGGYSPYDASIAHYREAGYRFAALIEYTIIFGMLLGGINFLVHYRVCRRQIAALWDHFEIRVFWAIILGAVLLVLANRLQVRPRDRNEAAVRDSLFQVTAIVTTTGFATRHINNEALFPAVARQVFLVLMVIGGCVGSTSGGFKVLRIGVLLKVAGRQARRITQPRNVVEPLVVDRVVVDAEGIRQIAGLFFAWVVLLVVGGLITAWFSDLGAEQSFSGMCSALGNIGPCYIRVEQMIALHPAIKVTYIIGMLAGRLEIVPVLMLLTRRLWR